MRAADSVMLLAHRARYENLGRTFRIVRRAGLEQDLRRAFVFRLSVDGFAGLESLAAAGRGRRRLTVGGAVLRRGAALAHGHGAGVRQSHDRVGGVLGDVAGLLANWSNVACVPCKSVLNLVVPSLSQWPIVSTKPGWKTESGAGVAEGLAADSPACWLGIWPGGRRAWAGAGPARPRAHAATTAAALSRT